MDDQFSHIHNATHYLIEKRFEAAMVKLKDIQQFIVSLVDRILSVVADMNLRLNYVLELCLGLTENPIHPSRDRSKTPMPEINKKK